MSLSHYLLGAAELALIATALCLGAYYVRAVILPGFSGAPARLAEVIFALTGLIVVSELVGVVGLFRPGWIVAGSVVVGVAAVLICRPRAESATGLAPPAPEIPSLMIWIGVAVAVIAVAHWAVPTQQSLELGMYRQDTIWYHMSFSARFVQDAQVGAIHFTDPLKVIAWFYPQNSELLHGVGIGAFGNDFLSPLINIGWLALCLLAAWCIGRPYGVAPLTLIAVAIVLDAPLMIEQAGNAPSDTIALFFLLALIAILVNGEAAVRAARGDAGDSDSDSRALKRKAGSAGAGSAPEPDSPPPISPRGTWVASVRTHFSGSTYEGPATLAGIGMGPLIVAGLAGGLALGTKDTLLAALGVITLALFYLAGTRNWGRFALVWVPALALPSIFWVARNVVLAHNPLPWIKHIGPIALPGPSQHLLYPRKPHNVIEYLTHPNFNVWMKWFVAGFHDRLGPLWILILAAAFAAMVAVVWRGRTPLIRLLALTGIVAVIAYMFTPLTASGLWGSPSGFAPNMRYLSPGLTIGLVLLPLATHLTEGRRVWYTLWALTGVFLISTVFQGNYAIEKAFGAVVLAGALVGVPVLISRLSRRGTSVVALAGIVVATFGLLVALGRPEEKRYIDRRYDTQLANPFNAEAGFRSTDQWRQIQQWARLLTDKRIGVAGRAGAFGQYVFYGNDLSNYVQYVGEEGPRGTYRPIGDCPEWRRQVNAGNYDYLVVTPPNGAPALQSPIERVWTGSDPGVHKLLDVPPAVVYKIDRPLDPSTCPPEIDPA